MSHIEPLDYKCVTAGWAHEMSEDIGVDFRSQHVLPLGSCLIDDSTLALRLFVPLPGGNRSIEGLGSDEEITGILHFVL